jgi:hypothetical protein
MCGAVVQTLAHAAGAPAPALPDLVNTALLLTTFTGLRLASEKGGVGPAWGGAHLRSPTTPPLPKMNVTAN